MIYLLAILIFVLCFIIGLTIYIVARRNGIVRCSSTKVNSMPYLNVRHSFLTIEPCSVTKQCPTKKAFDESDAKSYLTALALEDPGWLTALCSRVEHNRLEYEAYRADYDALLGSIYKVPYYITDYVAAHKNLWEKYCYKKWYMRRERRMCESAKIVPQTDCSIEVDIYYASPQGLNTYSKHYDLHYDEARSALDAAVTKLDYRDSARYQRSLMTDALRYDIMSRDGFRCTICGASAADGVILHVDHIVPVSKGGRTEPDNLRTLCDRCNLGKRDKLEFPAQ